MSNASNRTSSRLLSHSPRMIGLLADNYKSHHESELEAENADLRDLLTKAGIDVARLLAQAGADATESQAAKRLQTLLLGEVHHRLKNTLATVVAIVSQSLRTAENLEQGRLAVESRLLALGKAHDLLLQANWASANLADIIGAAIKPFDDNGIRRFSVQGIQHKVGPGAVLPLTMILNELCTNAVKYGALSNATGHVEIASTVDDQAGLFRLTWIEKDGPPVREPVRRSFGSRLLSRLANQIHGSAQLRFEPAGAVYELEAPFVHATGGVHQPA